MRPSRERSSPSLAPSTSGLARAGAWLLGLVAGCAVPGAHPGVPLVVGTQAPAPLSSPNWKERLEQPYLYVERLGDYRGLGAAFQELAAAAERAGIRPAGPSFALFFDDPALVAAEALRARACLPVEPGVAAAGLGADVLPRAMVAYARTSGSYPATAPATAALLEYLASHGWSHAGPVREVYLDAVAPGGPSATTEVQVPWRPALALAGATSDASPARRCP